MRAARLRQALASLYEDLLPASARLSGEAEHAISQRVARRWATRGIGAAVAGALAFVGANAIVVATDSHDDAPAAASPTASSAPMPELVRIPLGGGPEFEGLEDYPICGRPAPEPQPTQRGFTLEASVGPATDQWPDQTAESVTAQLSYVDGNPGTSSRGPLWVVLVRDGKVAGAMTLDHTRLERAVTTERGDDRADFPAYSEAFQCRKLSLRGPREYDLFPVEPGDYTAVAYTRVFASEESVALGQALGGHYYLAENQKLPGGIYRPGSFDCAYLESFGGIVRACLPDIAPGAVVDTAAQTLSLRYDPARQLEPFDVTLVSEPFDVTLRSWQEHSDGAWVGVSTEIPTRFASGADIVCGATVEDFGGFERMGDSQYDSRLGPDGLTIAAVLPTLGQSATGVIDAKVMPWFAPDGSSVRLEAGARLVYFHEDGVSDAGFTRYQVAGFAAVDMLGLIPHDRYRGPTDVQLRVGEAKMCPDVEADDRQLSADAAIWGTWTVTPPQGIRLKRELLTATSGWLPSLASNVGPVNY